MKKYSNVLLHLGIFLFALVTSLCIISLLPQSLEFWNDVIDQSSGFLEGLNREVETLYAQHP